MSLQPPPSRFDRLKVECQAGYRGEETPRRFWIGRRCVTVVRVIDCWLAPDYRYFKLLGDDGDVYMLRHDEPKWQWSLTTYRIGP
jgi:hypothetical protein